MLETCLNNKTIRQFLLNYEQRRWKKLVPSLIEIAILNLNSSFHTIIFSEEDIDNILNDLKMNQNVDNIDNKEKPKIESNSHVIFSKPSNQWRTADGGIPPISGNKEREFLFDNSSITNKSKYSKDNNEIERENIMNRRNIKNTRSKIKEQVDNDKRNYYNRMKGGKKMNNKPIEKINYAISYDKNLEPEIIEKTTINKNRKGGKKIVEKMTQEEYEQKFPDEAQNIENECEEEEENNDDNNNEQNYEENEEIEYYAEENNNQVQDNNQIKNRKNLYHYKTDFNNKNNNIIIINNQGKQINNNNELIQNPQQSFNPKNFRNNQQNPALNQGKNNYINIENNTNEQQIINNDYNYNPNPSEQYNNNNNYKIGMSESDDKSSKFIGIEQKYEKKIDELEKNIINNNGNNINNIDNYADKLKVNITNMEEYSKNNNNNIEYQKYKYNNNNEEGNENEENNLNDMDINDIDGGVLSQMSNMSERTKSLFKRTMDEYPPLEEDTF